MLRVGENVMSGTVKTKGVTLSRVDLYTTSKEYSLYGGKELRAVAVTPLPPLDPQEVLKTGVHQTVFNHLSTGVAIMSNALIPVSTLVPQGLVNACTTNIEGSTCWLYLEKRLYFPWYVVWCQAEYCRAIDCGQRAPIEAK